MWTKIWNWILLLFRRIENHTTPKEDEVRLTLEETKEELKELAEPSPEDSSEEIPMEDKPVNNRRVVIAEFEEFDGPLTSIPRTRYGAQGVYALYGRAPKEDRNTQYPKAKLVVAKNLPGSWNGGKPRLYILELMEPYLREFLLRCRRLEVLDYFERLGAYNHRNMRHDPEAELSMHAWAAAIDFNTGDNRACYRNNKWFRKGANGYIPCDPYDTRCKKGPVPPPFSKGWLQIWPKGVPYTAVRALISVGFEWGGDWGRHKWIHLVERFGVGYDESGLDLSIEWIKEAVHEWETIRYIDPMHGQLKLERPRMSTIVG